MAEEAAQADPLAAAADNDEEPPAGTDVSPDMLQRLDEIVRHGDRASLSVKTIFLQLATEFDVALTPPMKEVMRSEIHRLLVVLDEAVAGIIRGQSGLCCEGEQRPGFEFVVRFCAQPPLKAMQKWRSRLAKSTRS